MATAPVVKDSKYIVLKRDDDLDANFGSAILDLLEQLALEDAIVIRRQDVFAPPALDAYANAITVTIEGILASAGVTTPSALPKGSDLFPIVRNLLEVSDYFHAQAEEAWHTERKLPD